MGIQVILKAWGKKNSSLLTWVLYLSWSTFCRVQAEEHSNQELLVHLVLRGFSPPTLPPIPLACIEMSMTSTQMAAPVFLGNIKSSTSCANLRPLSHPALCTFLWPMDPSQQWPWSDWIDVALQKASLFRYKWIY